jgi:coproporphyrinogen III oxidase-like Fe-S oxidoreductase
MFPETRRIFLADGDAFVLSSSRLERILDTLSESFPLLQRVSAYANPSNLLAKSVDEMRRLKEKKLAVLYYGIESGDPAVLEKVDKGATPEQMAEGCLKAAESGIKLSVTVILGLAGRKGSLAHARATASLVNTIRPRFLSALTLMLGPYEKEFSRSMGPGFEYNSPVGDVRELRELVAGITADKCIFRSNHASNYLALKGTLQKDREALLKLIDSALKDPDGYFRDEWMRGL